MGLFKRGSGGSGDADKPPVPAAPNMVDKALRPPVLVAHEVQFLCWPGTRADGTEVKLFAFEFKGHYAESGEPNTLTVGFFYPDMRPVMEIMAAAYAHGFARHRDDVFGGGEG